MNKYHKIQTVFKRNPETNYSTLLMGDFASPEFRYLKDNTWIWKEKVDGTNIRVLWEDKKIRFKGRSENAQIPTFLFEKLQNIFYDREGEFEVLFNDASVCLYGEGYGAKIQKGGGNYIEDGVDFVLFDVKVGGWWLKDVDVLDIAFKLNLDIVPEVGQGTLEEMVDFVQKGFNSRWGDFPAEGVVAKPEVDLFARNGGRIITKLKHKDFKDGGK